MGKLTIIAGVAAFVSLSAFAQKEVKGDVGKGSPIISVFTNFHSGFGSVNDDRGFDLERAYIGYQYSLLSGLQIKGVVDFGQSKDVRDCQRIGYVKNAQVTWMHGRWTLNGGLISTVQFKVQEDFWGKRYIMKSFQDEYKFGSSADLGCSAAYRFNRLLSVDVILVNGEGYKKVQVKNGMLYGTGLTLTSVEGLTFRAYASYNEATESGQKGSANLAAFVGFKNSRAALAAEYNYMTNTSYKAGQDQSGVSVYGMIRLHAAVEAFGRWDYLASKNGWNKADDGNAYLIGAEFAMGKHVKLSPNFRMSYRHGADSRYYMYVNASFSL